MLFLLAACIFSFVPDDGEAGLCANSRDDDGDGRTDCADSDCDAAPVCNRGIQGRDTGPDTGVDPPDDTGDCPGTFTSSIPTDGAVDAYYRAAVEFELASPDASAWAEADFVGVSSLSDDGRTVLFTPFAPLSPNTAYSATVHGCFGSSTIKFTTSDYGSPLADPAALLGRTYRLDLAEGRWLVPASTGSLFAAEIERAGLLHITGVDEGSLSLFVAAAAADETPIVQDPTVNTAQLSPADFTAAPWFVLNTPTAVFPFAGVNVEVHNAALEGTFAADGSGIGGGRVTGEIDTRSLASLLDAQAEPESMCETLLSVGVECVDCPDGEPLCVEVVVDRLTASEVPGAEVVEVTDGTGTCAVVGAALPLGWWGAALLRRRRKAAEARSG